MKTVSALCALLALGAVTELPGRAHASAVVIGAPETNLDIEIGKGRLVRLTSPAATVFVADPKIADVQVKSPTLVYVYGRAPGSTSLFAVDGHDQMIASLSVNVGIDEVRLRQTLAAEVPGAQVQVASANGALIVSGKVASAQQGDDVMRIAAVFAPGDDKDKTSRIINRLVVEAPNQINLRVVVAEVTREASKELDFNWETLSKIGGSGLAGVAIGGDIIDATNKLVRPNSNLGAIVGGISDSHNSVAGMLQALEEKQLVTILAQPNLTAVSGEPASFLAGGEYPIPVPQGLNQVTIQYKQYGVSLNFTATILDGGRISLNVRPEVSQLSSSGAITLNNITVPALTTRKADTTVELASGQSFAIAGLLQNNITQDLKKFPGLGDTPILGPLFRSRRFQRDQSELVIIVTPYLVKPSDHRLAAPTDQLADVPAAAARTAAQVNGKAGDQAAAQTPPTTVDGKRKG